MTIQEIQKEYIKKIKTRRNETAYEICGNILEKLTIEQKINCIKEIGLERYLDYLITNALEEHIVSWARENKF